jgi:hypothetical protein
MRETGTIADYRQNLHQTKRLLLQLQPGSAAFTYRKKRGGSARK